MSAPLREIKGFEDQVDMYQNMGQFLMRVDLTRYWTYPGSLTTPTCNEAVTWMVFDTVLGMKPRIVRASYFKLIFKMGLV